MALDLKAKNNLNLFLNSYFEIFIVVIVVLVLVLSYFFIIKPKYDLALAAITTDIKQQQKLYAEQVKKLNNLKTISSLYEKISPADLKKFNGVLPDDYVKESLFGELDELITQNGFILTSVSINKEEPGLSADGPVKSTKVGTLNIQLAISSIDYPGFKNLLRLLENNLRLFDVTNLSFSPSGNSASLTLTTYYYNK